MPELWARDASGVNRKFRGLWARDVSGVNHKQKELWSRDSAAINRKIFSGDFETYVSELHLDYPGGYETGYFAPFQTLQNGVWRFGYSVPKWCGYLPSFSSVLTVKLDDSISSPITVKSANPFIKISNNIDLQLVAGIYLYNSNLQLIDPMYDVNVTDGWLRGNYYAHFRSPAFAKPSDNILKINISISCNNIFPVSGKNGDGQSCEFPSGAVTINDIPIEF